MNFIRDSNLIRVRELEKTILDGKQAFLRVGAALHEIRDNKYYRLTHSTFALYVEDKFGFSPQHAGRICKAAELAPVLEPIGSNVTESQAREVAKAPVSRRDAVVHRAVEMASELGRKPTARIIAEARKQVVAEIVQDDTELYEDVLDECDDDASQLTGTQETRHPGEHNMSELFATNAAKAAITQLKGIQMKSNHRRASFETVIKWISTQYPPE